ncbi:MAG: hypothetical protein FD177_941 [Desulfovibrionaceae bacterium]|nr:MAG: hypothetical protein FD177_941 [Desulfovibrionaceae bacterium]
MCMGMPIGLLSANVEYMLHYARLCHVHENNKTKDRACLQACAVYGPNALG